MNPIYEKQVFYALNELYLDSVRLDPDLDFDWDDLDCRRRPRRFRARDSSPESISDMEVPGSVRVMELGKSLICCLVLDSRSQGLWQALQLSMFTEFGATGDLIVKARGGAYLALAENSFLLTEEEISQSVVVDRVGLYDLMKAREFVEQPDRERYGRYLLFGLPHEVRQSFVLSEFDLSCELRSRFLPEPGWLVLPAIIGEYYHARPRILFDLRIDEELVLYNRYESSKQASMREPSSPIASIHGRDDVFEIVFDDHSVGQWASLYLKRLLIFRGKLPASLKLKLPFSIDLMTLREMLKLSF